MNLAARLMISKNRGYEQRRSILKGMDCHKLAGDDVHFLREVATGGSDF
jgi:hypothetical protein